MVAVKKRNEPGQMAEGRELEVQHLAETTDLSPKMARELLEKNMATFGTASVRKQIDIMLRAERRQDRTSAIASAGP